MPFDENQGGPQYRKPLQVNKPVGVLRSAKLVATALNQAGIKTYGYSERDERNDNNAFVLIASNEGERAWYVNIDEDGYFLYHDTNEGEEVVADVSTVGELIKAIRNHVN